MLDCSVELLQALIQTISRLILRYSGLLYSEVWIMHELGF